MVITVKPSPSADSRTADKNRKISFEEFSKSTDMHREDVKNMMDEIARMIQEAGEKHDWTKKEKENEFYNSFTAAKEEGKDFKKDNWYRYHTRTERHHIASYVHNDINLLDVIEMICDCCCAGYARSGKVYDIDIDDDVLKKAYENTVKLIKGKIKIDKF